ncbi:MAG TPA: ATP phosphoribosyltransferase regulatory subunit, partial [Anaeromyxobacter sp.]
VLRGGSSNGARDEFYQVGAELLGAAGSDADCEIVLRCLGALRACGPGPWHFTLSAAGALEVLLEKADAGPDRGPRLLAAIRRRASAEAARLGAEVSPEWGALARRLAQGRLEPDDPRLSGIEGGETLVRAARSLAEAGVADAAIDLADAAPRSYYSGFFFSVFGPTGGEPVAGGGRYDGLYGEFGAARPAVGFSLGLEGALA